MAQTIAVAPKDLVQEMVEVEKELLRDPGHIILIHWHATFAQRSWKQLACPEISLPYSLLPNMPHIASRYGYTELAAVLFSSSNLRTRYRADQQGDSHLSWKCLHVAVDNGSIEYSGKLEKVSVRVFVCVPLASYKEHLPEGWRAKRSGMVDTMWRSQFWIGEWDDL